MRSASDAVILLISDGLVAVGRVLGGFRRRSGWERQAQAVDALNALEDNQDGLEPGQLTESPKWLRDAIDAANQYAAETYLHFIPERSAAVSPPAADNTTEVDHLEAAWHYHRPQANYNGNLVWGCEGCNWHGPTIQAHSRHRFHVLADMKNATTRVQEQLGGTA